MMEQMMGLVVMEIVLILLFMNVVQIAIVLRILHQILDVMQEILLF